MEIKNTVFLNQNISLKAKGLLAQIAFMKKTHSDYVTMSDLLAMSKDGIKSLRGGIRELEEHGLLIRTREHELDGTFYYHYEINGEAVNE